MLSTLPFAEGGTMVIPNGWSANKGFTGETYSWPSDDSQGTSWDYPITEDLIELKHTWAKLTYITFEGTDSLRQKRGLFWTGFDLSLRETNLSRSTATGFKSLLTK